VRMCMHISACVHISEYMCAYVYAYKCMCIRVNIRACMCVYLSLFLHLYSHLHAYTQISSRKGIHNNDLPRLPCCSGQEDWEAAEVEGEGQVVEDKAAEKGGGVHFLSVTK